MRYSLLACISAFAFGCGGSRADDSTSTPTPTYTAEQRAAAQKVIANSKELCTIRDESVNNEPSHLVVECKSNIANEQRLDFANAIANADVIISGKPRNIYFYLPGGQQFAQADPLNGVRLK